MDPPPDRVPAPCPKLREGVDPLPPPKLLPERVEGENERLGVEGAPLPKLRPELPDAPLGVNVLLGLVLGVVLSPKERWVLGRVTVERVLLCRCPKERDLL